ncbi:MAG TPA: hypothetical protein VMB19_15815 [Silvibacterium sp.]|nr:hypothetical protein [Silvibacterium sp.]
MKNFTLTLYAKRRSDGNYDYSLKVWENRATGSLFTATNFESQSLIAQQLETVLPIGGDAASQPSAAENAEEFWFPFTMPMSEEQAANLGWRNDVAPEQGLLN